AARASRRGSTTTSSSASRGRSPSAPAARPGRETHVLIAGNLDVETTWARLDAAARRARGGRAPSPDDPRFALPERVLRKISGLATLLRVFATSDDDELWTPRPVEASRIVRLDWLPSPRLVGGPMPERADLWWGRPTEVAARVNHRSFVLD